MTAKKAALSQYRSIVDTAALSAAALKTPAEGWMRTVRKALGMSGAQLAGRMGLTRSRVAQAETAELSGGVTLKSLEAAAAAMGCRLVYAIVPYGRIEDVVAAQARAKAEKVVVTTNRHMALEGQLLPPDQIKAEIARLTEEIARTMPPDLWTDR